MPEAGPSPYVSASGSGHRWLVFAYFLALTLLLAIAAFAYQESQRARGARAAVSHTHRVIQHALKLESAAISMEASHRAFLVRGEEFFLQRRDGHLQNALAEADAIRRLTADNPSQSARIPQVIAALQKRLQLMRQTVDLSTSTGLDSARRNFRASGEGSIDPIRRELQAIIAEEEALLSQRNQVSAGNAARLDAILVYGTGLAFLLLIAAGVALLRQLRRTERIRARLAESGERLEFTYEASRIGAWDLDLDSGRLGCDNRCDQVFGHSHPGADRNWEQWQQQVHADDRGAVAAAVRDAQLSGGSWGQECRILWPDGSQHWIWICGRSRDQGNGRSRRMLGTVTDITARKRAEEELESLFRSSRDLICICSFDGRFLRLNPAWQRTLGYTEAEMLGKPFIDFVHPDDVPATLAEAQRQSEGQDAVLFENRYRCRDGQWRWLLWNASPSVENRVIYASARDISERKEDERRIAALNLELSARGRALEEANRELEAFSYSVSHDLRAPLRHIDGYARMLAEDNAGRLEPESLRYLETITDSARRMGTLIDDLLALARLGRKPVACQPVDMQVLAREALQETPGAAGIVELGPLPACNGDAGLLKQVWINLLSNAVKYSGPRGDQARIEIAGVQHEGASVYTISDNGVGFDMRYADKLFGVFQRLHGQDQFEGTGVGLAIVQRIVSRHGGRVSADAEPGRGACFRFEIPQLEDAA